MASVKKSKTFAALLRLNGFLKLFKNVLLEFRQSNILLHIRKNLAVAAQPIKSGCLS